MVAINDLPYVILFGTVRFFLNTTQKLSSLKITETPKLKRFAYVGQDRFLKEQYVLLKKQCWIFFVVCDTQSQRLKFMYITQINDSKCPRLSLVMLTNV